jgi:hypothetical protein
MKDSDGNDLPLKAELEKLPAALKDIKAALDEANHKINSIANPEVLRPYEGRLREIAQIEGDIAASSEVQHAKKTELSSQFKPWEAALKNTVTKVNVLFTSYMMELGIAGEVRLASGAVAGEVATSRIGGLEFSSNFVRRLSFRCYRLKSTRGAKGVSVQLCTWWHCKS